MNEKVSEVMSPGVATLKPRDSLKHAAAMMEACDVGPMPVCDGDRMVGILTDRDITVRAVAQARPPGHHRRGSDDAPGGVLLRG
jgi:CBS domain-containing protein